MPHIDIFVGQKSLFWTPQNGNVRSALWLRRDEGAGIWPPGRSGKNVGFCSALMRDGGFLVPPINAAYRYFRRTHHFATWKKSLFWTPQNAWSRTALWLRGDEAPGIWPCGRAVKNVGSRSGLKWDVGFLVRPIDPAHRSFHRTHHFQTSKKFDFLDPPKRQCPGVLSGYVGTREPEFGHPVGQ